MSTPQSSVSRATGRQKSASGDVVPSANVQTVIRQLRVVFRALQNHSRSIEKACGVSAAQLWALWELHRSPGLRVGDLSQRLLIHPSTASNMLDKLERKHLVERRRTGADQRVVSLFLTGRGETLLEEAPAPAQGTLNLALQALPARQLEALETGLSALLDTMQASDERAALQPIAGDD
jgi:MarR family transcriptional regulator, organic hydroperoxide resistance regulator